MYVFHENIIPDVPQVEVYVTIRASYVLPANENRWSGIPLNSFIKCSLDSPPIICWQI